VWTLISEISVFKFFSGRDNLAKFWRNSVLFHLVLNQNQENREKEIQRSKFALCDTSGVRENPVVGGKDKICVRFLSFVLV
jgi:hypothetical protein